jgi:hypothetical protein
VFVRVFFVSVGRRDDAWQREKWGKATAREEEGRQKKKKRTRRKERGGREGKVVERGGGVGGEATNSPLP